MLKTVLTFSILMLVTSIGHAHHNWAGNYDVKSDTEIEGVVDSIQWRNPHIQLMVTVQSKDGEKTKWAVESNSVGSLTRMGVTKDLLQPGVKVKVAGYQALKNTHGVFMNHLLLPDKREIIFLRDAAPRWKGEFIGNTDKLNGKVIEEDINKRPENLFTVWTTIYGARESRGLIPKSSDAYPLTEVAQKTIAGYDLVNDHPLKGCEPKGMPAAMDQPYPMEIVDQGEKILIKLEEYDAVRIVHLKDEHNDSEQSASTMGYSTGRWQGDRLIVTTTKLGYGFLNVGALPNPIPQGTETHLIETFHMRADRYHLDYSLVVTDSSTLKRPMAFSKYWQWTPGATVDPYDCAEN